MKPNEIMAVNLTDNRSVEKIITTLESKSPIEVQFAIRTQYAEESGATSIPLYIQVCTGGNGTTGYKYTLSLKNTKTNKTVFKDVVTSMGRLASIKIKANIDPTATHILTVQAPASVSTKKHWLTRQPIYEPTMWVYIGPHRSQMTELQF